MSVVWFDLKLKREFRYSWASVSHHRALQKFIFAQKLTIPLTLHSILKIINFPSFHCIGQYLHLLTNLTLSFLQLCGYLLYLLLTFISRMQRHSLSLAARSLIASTYQVLLILISQLVLLLGLLHDTN